MWEDSFSNDVPPENLAQYELSKIVSFKEPYVQSIIIGATKAVISKYISMSVGGGNYYHLHKSVGM